MKFKMKAKTKVTKNQDQLVEKILSVSFQRSTSYL